MDEKTTAERIVGAIRALANVALLIGAILLLIAWATHWPPETVAPLGLLTLLAFIISFVAILIENRLPGKEEET